jgi:hypothetical protein
MAAGKRRLRVMAVLWPAFLMAGVLETLVFALVDPSSLHGFGGAPVEWSNSGVYTLAFFVFWGVIAAAGTLTQLLALSADDLNANDSATPPPS